MQSESLESLRAELEAVDAAIVGMLSRRFEICGRVAAYKMENGVPMMQPERIRFVEARVADLAAGQGLDPKLAARIFRAIIEAACEFEGRIMVPSDAHGTRSVAP
jgi:4-amino-4-deoxychorismate mutase